MRTASMLGGVIVTCGLFGRMCHVIAAMTAHHRANKKNRAAGVGG